MFNKTSIIVVAYDTLRIQRQITSACIGNIAKYTNRDEYELIFIDQGDMRDLDDRHQHIDIDKWIRIPHIGLSASMNKGYKESNSEYPYIVFMHNDVFVWEGWLGTLRSFVDKGRIVMPCQGIMSREKVKQYYKEESPYGYDDAGMVMMSKEDFRKTGGWDERFKAIYQEVPFRSRFKKPFFCTGKCIITHIGCGTVYADDERENKDYAIEGQLSNDLRSYGTGKDINYL